MVEDVIVEMHSKGLLVQKLACRWCLLKRDERNVLRVVYKGPKGGDSNEIVKQLYDWAKANKKL